MTDDLPARLARRSTLRRALGFGAISVVILASVIGRAATEPAPRSALAGTDLAQPVDPTGAHVAPSASAATSPAARRKPTSAKHRAKSAGRHSLPAPTKATSAAKTPVRKTPVPKTSASKAATPRTSTPRTSAPAPPTTPAPTTTAATTALRTVTGAAYDVHYGTVQVRVTFKGTRLVEVTAVSLPEGGRSGDVSAMAAPQLRREALAAQSAHIDSVSGASYTSAGYAQSLQSAIDRVGNG